MSNAAANPKTQDIDRLIRKYFDGCNEADIEKIMSCFVPDAVHFFPPGMYEGPFRGSRKIAEKWRDAVQNIGSYWTVDRLIIEPSTSQAAMEWTHFKTGQQKILRGIEWYEIDEASGLIREIRAYYASPQAPDLDLLELEGFDYTNRGYPSGPPPGAR